MASQSQDLGAPTPGFKRRIPPSILTPGEVETRLGTLRFRDGLPDAETAKALYENLDLLRGMEVFLQFVPAASFEAFQRGFVEAGCTSCSHVLITERLLHAAPLLLTGNTDTVYSVAVLDLKRDGPTVVEVPPHSGPSMINDAFFRYICDFGPTGPDKGAGGKYLILPPDDASGIACSTEAPVDVDGERYFAVRSPSYTSVYLARGMLQDGKPDAAVGLLRSFIKIYPHSQRRAPPPMVFRDFSELEFNTIHASDFGFFRELHAFLQREHEGLFDPELLGLAAAIGLRKGQPFEPDARMKSILEEAAAIGNATARSLFLRPRNPAAYYWPGSSWYRPWIDVNYEFLSQEGLGGRNLDSRALFFYCATFNSPAMLARFVGRGSQYALISTDAEGRYLLGSHSYTLRLPANAPAKDFWSLVLYDPQTRSELQTDQELPGLNSVRSPLVYNDDGTVDLFLGPEAPAGKEGNWLQTVRGKGWFALLRLYGPLDAWFDGSWTPGEVRLTREDPAPRQLDAGFSPPGATPGFKHKIPEQVLTADEVQTRLGALRFFDGLPDEETVTKLHEHLDFARAVQVFLDLLPAASMEALRRAAEAEGLKGCNEVFITNQLLDANPLLLTGNTDTVYVFGSLDLQRDGRTVVEVPPGCGPTLVNDAFFRFVVDMGSAGPDRGAGGKYLILPPDDEGGVDLPEGGMKMEIAGESYYVAKSSSYTNCIFCRGLLKDGKPDHASELFRKGLKIYPFGQRHSPPAMRFQEMSGAPVNTVFSNDFGFFAELDAAVQREHVGFLSPELRGLAASIGLRKGAAFAPDPRTRGLLESAVAVGNATARALFACPRTEEYLLYEDSYWNTPFGGDYRWLVEGGSGGRNLDARTVFFYIAVGCTPAMAMRMVGRGSQYAFTLLDEAGQFFDGGKNYRLSLPAGIPAKDFWSVVAYDTQTRSQLQTDQPFPGKNSLRDKLLFNADGSVDLYFGPEPGQDQQENWIQTVPGKGWFVALRLYGPLESWFAKAWRPGGVKPLLGPCVLAGA